MKHVGKDPIWVSDLLADPSHILIQTYAFAMDKAYDNNFPFLHFLVNKYVRPHYERLMSEIEFPADDAVFCLDMSTYDGNYPIHVSSKDAAAAQLRDRRRAASETYRVIDRRSQCPMRNGERINYIQVIAYEGYERLVVRYIPLDLKSEYFEFGKDHAWPNRDAVIVVMENIIGDSGPRQSWTHVDQEGKLVHIFNEIDDHVQKTFSESPPVITEA